MFKSPLWNIALGLIIIGIGAYALATGEWTTRRGTTIMGWPGQVFASGVVFAGVVLMVVTIIRIVKPTDNNDDD